MISSKLLFRIHYLSLPIKTSFQSRCFLHTSGILMNKDVTNSEQSLNSTDGKPTFKNNNKHMRSYMLEHEFYTNKELLGVKVIHKKAQTWHDRFAYAAVETLRFFFDLFTGYIHDEKSRKIMTEKQWLRRCIFLESIAGVPGMVAATCRHLKSLRSMHRDYGWIHTLVGEAENERMHLLTFIKLRDPGRIFHLFVFLAQGVFYNAFFLTYLISPKFAHRFVGYLEEEAVLTYTHCINELESGRLKAWQNLPAPDIAKNYWHLPDNALMIDVLMVIRADEANHRHINHKLADIGPYTPNPFSDGSEPNDLNKD